MPVFSWSKTAATNSTADSTINWAEGQAPSTVNDSARATMAAVKKWVDDVSGTVTTAGTSTAYTITTNSVFDTAAHMSGALICFIPHATSGAAPTLAVDGLTARAINISTGVAIATGALILGSPYMVTYIHATTEFILVGQPAAFGTLGATLTVQASSVGFVGFEAISTEAAAAAGPSFIAYRNSASPAASDFLGSYDFYGKDSGGTKTLYSRIVSQLVDATDGSEDASLLGQIAIAGTLTTVWTASATGVSIVGTVTSGSNPAATPGKLPTYQSFTSGSSQTYTTPAGVTWIRVRAVGGGGGGNGGGTGGTTTFNSVTAIGGSAGAAGSGATPGAGGIGGTGGSGGTLRITGGPGGQGAGGNSGVTGTINVAGGGGGNSVFGGGGGSALTTPIAPAANTGGGGAAPLASATTGNSSGGGGGAGEYFELLIAPTALQTFTYTVGAGGTGTGSGAAGRIIVEEYYN